MIVYVIFNSFVKYLQNKYQMLKKSGIDGIYVIHAKTGYELHENRIKALFKENNLNFEFVTDGDPSLFTKELLAKYFTDDMLSRWSDGIISCTLNHIKAYERIVKNNNSYAIVFENDPFFLENFSENIKTIVNEIKDLEKGFMQGWTSNYIKVDTQYKPELLNEFRTVNLRGLNENGTMNINFE